MSDKLIINLIKTLPNFYSVDDEGNNICHQIAKYGNKNIFNKIEKENYPLWSKILNQRNSSGHTPLHLAILNKNNSIADKFIKLGAHKLPDLDGNIFINKQNGGGSKKIKFKRFL